ncbi:MAG: NUDIX domain-containing protein [Aestuariibacter sp.]
MSETIDKLGWLLLKDSKLLVVRSKNKSLFYIPGGKRDAGESDSEALIREIKEELCVDLNPETISHAIKVTAPADGKADAKVQINCYYAAYQGTLTAAAEIAELAFVALEEESICSVATIEIMRWLKNNPLPE